MMSGALMGFALSLICSYLYFLSLAFLVRQSEVDFILSSSLAVLPLMNYIVDTYIFRFDPSFLLLSSPSSK